MFDLRACPPPAFIRISWQRVTIKVVEDLKADDGTPDWGSSDLNSYEVSINADCSERLALDTVLHELDHVVADFYGSFPETAEPSRYEREEHSILTLSNGRTELLVRNPELVEWMLARLQAIWLEDSRIASASSITVEWMVEDGDDSAKK